MSAADHVFGVGHRLHPVTKRPLESGIGCLPDDEQAKIHLADIEREEGKEVADRMRAEMNRPRRAEPRPVPRAPAPTEE